MRVGAGKSAVASGDSVAPRQARSPHSASAATTLAPIATGAARVETARRRHLTTGGGERGATTRGRLIDSGAVRSSAGAVELRSRIADQHGVFSSREFPNLFLDRSAFALLAVPHPTAAQRVSLEEGIATATALVNRGLAAILTNLKAPCRMRHGEVTLVPVLEHARAQLEAAGVCEAHLEAAAGMVRSALGYLYELTYRSVTATPSRTFAETVAALESGTITLPLIGVSGSGSDWDMCLRTSPEQHAVAASVMETVKNDLAAALQARGIESEIRNSVSASCDIFGEEQIREAVAQGGSQLDWLTFDLVTHRMIEPPGTSVIRDVVCGVYRYVAPADASRVRDAEKQTVRGLRALFELPFLQIADDQRLRSEIESIRESIRHGGVVSDKAIEQWQKTVRNARFAGAHNRCGRAADGSLDALVGAFAQELSTALRERQHRAGVFPLLPEFADEFPLVTRASHNPIDRLAGVAHELGIADFDPQSLRMPVAQFIAEHTDKGILYHGTPTLTGALAMTRGGMFVSQSGQGQSARGRGGYSTPDGLTAASYAGDHGVVFSLPVHADPNLNVLDWRSVGTHPVICALLERCGGDEDALRRLLARDFGVDIIIDEHVLIQNAAAVEFPRDIADLTNTYSRRALSRELGIELRLEAFLNYQSLYPLIELFGGAASQHPSEMVGVAVDYLRDPPPEASQWKLEAALDAFLSWIDQAPLELRATLPEKMALWRDTTWRLFERGADGASELTSDVAEQAVQAALRGDDSVRAAVADMAKRAFSEPSYRQKLHAELAKNHDSNAAVAAAIVLSACGETTRDTRDAWRRVIDFGRATPQRLHALAPTFEPRDAKPPASLAVLEARMAPALDALPASRLPLIEWDLTSHVGYSALVELTRAIRDDARVVEQLRVWRERSGPTASIVKLALFVNGKLDFDALFENDRVCGGLSENGQHVAAALLRGKLAPYAAERAGASYFEALRHLLGNPYEVADTLIAYRRAYESTTAHAGVPPPVEVERDAVASYLRGPNRDDAAGRELTDLLEKLHLPTAELIALAARDEGYDTTLIDVMRARLADEPTARDACRAALADKDLRVRATAAMALLAAGEGDAAIEQCLERALSVVDADAFVGHVLTQLVVAPGTRAEALRQRLLVGLIQRGAESAYVLESAHALIAGLPGVTDAYFEAIVRDRRDAFLTARCDSASDADRERISGLAKFVSAKRAIELDALDRRASSEVSRAVIMRAVNDPEFREELRSQPCALSAVALFMSGDRTASTLEQLRAIPHDARALAAAQRTTQRSPDRLFDNLVALSLLTGWSPPLLSLRYEAGPVVLDAEQELTLARMALTADMKTASHQDPAVAVAVYLEKNPPKHTVGQLVLLEAALADSRCNAIAANIVPTSDAMLVMLDHARASRWAANTCVAWLERLVDRSPRVQDRLDTLARDTTWHVTFRELFARQCSAWRMTDAEAARVCSDVSSAIAALDWNRNGLDAIEPLLTLDRTREGVQLAILGMLGHSRTLDARLLGLLRGLPLSEVALDRARALGRAGALDYQTRDDLDRLAR